MSGSTLSQIRERMVRTGEALNQPTKPRQKQPKVFHNPLAYGKYDQEVDCEFDNERDDD